MKEIISAMPEGKRVQIQIHNTMSKTMKGRITDPTQATKFAELLFITIAAILMAAMLTGCNTTQTLAAQFGAAPLPTKVARKLYGTCGSCNLDVNCPVCKATQAYNRKLAAAPSYQKAQYPVAGTSWREHQAILNYQSPQNTQRGYQSYQSYQNPQNPQSSQGGYNQRGYSQGDYQSFNY
jgi:hypothetical protein